MALAAPENGPVLLACQCGLNVKAWNRRCCTCFGGVATSDWMLVVSGLLFPVPDSWIAMGVARCPPAD
jgi:hypothetical protein